MRIALVLGLLVACNGNGGAAQNGKNGVDGDTGADCLLGEGARFTGVTEPVCLGGSWTIAWQMEGEVSHVVLNIFDLAAPSVEEHSFADDIAFDEACGTAAPDQSKDLTASGNLNAGGTTLACDRGGDAQVTFVLRHLAENPEHTDCVLFGWDPTKGAAILDNPDMTSGVPTWADTADRCRWVDFPAETTCSTASN